MATYVVLIGWVLGYPILIAIQLTSIGRFIPAGSTGASLAINPYGLALQATMSPSSYHQEDGWLFLASTLAIATALTALGCWRLSPATLGDSSSIRRRWSLPRPPRLSLVSLDAYPLFWRECRLRTPTRWIGLLWAVYVVGAILFTALAISAATESGTRRWAWTGPFNGFQTVVGLVLLSIVSPAALAEERSRGSLEVLLTTPLSTSSLVLSKWCACYRGVFVMALLPTLVAMAHAVQSGRWRGVPLVLGTVLVQGAAITSLGIALATWSARIERALILSVAASVLMTVAWIPFVLLLFAPTNSPSAWPPRARFWALLCSPTRSESRQLPIGKRVLAGACSGSLPTPPFPCRSSSRLSPPSTAAWVAREDHRSGVAPYRRLTSAPRQPQGRGRSASGLRSRRR